MSKKRSKPLFDEILSTGTAVRKKTPAEVKIFNMLSTLEGKSNTVRVENIRNQVRSSLALNRCSSALLLIAPSNITHQSLFSIFSPRSRSLQICLLRILVELVLLRHDLASPPKQHRGFPAPSNRSPESFESTEGLCRDGNYQQQSATRSKVFSKLRHR